MEWPWNWESEIWVAVWAVLATSAAIALYAQYRRDTKLIGKLLNALNRARKRA